MLKKKDGKNSDGASEKSDKARVVKEAYENSCDVLTAKSEKEKYSDVWLLDLGCTTTCTQKKSGSELTSLMRNVLS